MRVLPALGLELFRDAENLFHGTRDHADVRGCLQAVSGDDNHDYEGIHTEPPSIVKDLPEPV